MNTDPQQIRTQVDAILADLPHLDSDAADVTGEGLDSAVDIDQVGRRLEQAHQILVEALESVEKG